MKQQLSILTIAIIIFGAVAISSFQNGKENKGKGNKEQNDKQDKNQGKDKDKGNKDGDKGNGKGNDQKDKDKKDKSNNGNDKDKERGNDDKDNGNNGNGKYKMKDGFKWDNETFRDRDKFYKNQDKVSICHKANRDNEPAVTIRVSENALKAHMNHGDAMGECTNVNNGTFSDIFIKRRTEYFTTLQDSYEQVSYSRSILDYAMERLTGTRTQLVTLQSNNAPVADIERKRVLVVDLEQNVSLLERLIGVTANLVANKLMN
jgi:cobalamin biosynthesis protein CobT